MKRPTLLLLAPVRPVTDLEHSVSHYRDLGFAVELYHGTYAFARRDAAELHLALMPDLEPAVGAAAVFLRVDHAEVSATGWDDREPVQTPCGQREGAHMDPDNNLLRYGSR